MTLRLFAAREGSATLWEIDDPSVFTDDGSALVGTLYVLDEPSIGLHQRDNDRLLGTLRHLRDIGNSVLVVEHDEDACIRGKEAPDQIELGRRNAAAHEGDHLAMAVLVERHGVEEAFDDDERCFGRLLPGAVEVVELQ